MFESFPGAKSTEKVRPERVLGDREHGCSVLDDGVVMEVKKDLRIFPSCFVIADRCHSGVLPYMHNQWTN